MLKMDWQQVALNGGPPCFFIEGAHYCGRAKRWPGHGKPAFHEFVSLELLLDEAATAALEQERKRILGLINGLREEGVGDIGWQVLRRLIAAIGDDKEQ